MRRCLFGLFGLVAAILTATETWTCNSIRWSQTSVIPPWSTACPGATSTGNVTQTAAYQVWVYNAQSQASTDYRYPNVIGNGTCGDLSHSALAPSFVPVISGTQWYVTVTGYTAQYDQYDRITTIQKTITTGGSQTMNLPPCTCSVLDCKNPARGTQCSQTCATGNGGGGGCGACPCGTVLCGAGCCFVPNSPCGSPPTNSLTCCHDSGGDHPCCYGQAGSPILIRGSEWAVSGYLDGVVFDLYATGFPLQIPWPKAAAHDGWLALPDAAGQVPDSRFLFGNHTPGADRAFSCGFDWQATGGDNGFRALSQYDQNHDCVIDAQDPIWTRLRVWYDNAPRNGVVDAGELMPVSSVLHSIPLRYAELPYTDAQGNQYRYCSTAAVCDVFLVRGQ